MVRVYHVTRRLRTRTAIRKVRRVNLLESETKRTSAARSLDLCRSSLVRTLPRGLAFLKTIDSHQQSLYLSMSSEKKSFRKRMETLDPCALINPYPVARHVITRHRRHQALPQQITSASCGQTALPNPNPVEWCQTKISRMSAPHPASFDLPASPNCIRDFQRK